jgi:hypothetical protein
VLNIYRSLGPKERTLVWVALVTAAVLIASRAVVGVGLVAGA